MLRVAVLATLAIAAFCAPVPNSVEDIPAEYKSLIPKEVLDHLTGITAEEKAAIKELAAEHKTFKDETEFLAALKTKSPSLAEKVAKLQALLEAKYAELDESAKALIKKVVAKGRELHQDYLAGKKPSLETLKNLAAGYITDYKNLSDDSKATIEKNFPILTNFFKNEKVQALIGQHIPN
ncbi:unnamed protein product [Caenorhabditis angaria]|uniref:Fatty-acid and retinol-binding protein 1 n=1 Tax=Caenorhabditis angaria TaxID=860376 RepID=A0A9P1IK38_9PELO|nr:unnamed protein product [Caenorhabditis angaria]